MRLQVHIIPAHAAPGAPPVSTFLEVAPPSLSLEDLTSSITNRYRRLYPHRPPLRIDRLQDSAQNDLDLSYTVEDVFSDKASDTLSSIVRVVQASSVRESSIPPESGLRMGQFARRKRPRPTGMMEAVREASSERGQPYLQPPSHSQSASLQPSRGSGRQRSSKRQKMNDFSVEDSMDERDDNLAIRNWNNEVESDPLVERAGAEFEDYNYDGVLGEEDNDSFKSYNSGSSPGSGHEGESIPAPELKEIGHNNPNAPLGNHDPKPDTEAPKPLQPVSQVPASPELQIVGHTKVSPEGHTSFDDIEHQETSRPVASDKFDKGDTPRPLRRSRNSRPLPDTPNTAEKPGTKKGGALAARAGRQTTAEKLAVRAGHITTERASVKANPLAASVPPAEEPGIYSVPGSDEEDLALPMPKARTPNSASKRPRKSSVVSETASEEGDESSQQMPYGRVTREKDEVEKESESERQALREEKESREREAKERQDKEVRELAAKAAEQREKAAKERAEKLRLEKERLEKERLEKERLEKERLEKERLEKEKLDKERLEKEKLEKEKLEKQRVAQEKLAAEKAEREKVAKEKAAQEKIAQLRAAKEAAALEKEKADQQVAARKAAEEASAVQKKAHGKGTLEDSQEKTTDESPTLKRKTRGAANRERLGQETVEETTRQEQKADRNDKKKETAKEKKEREALEKKQRLEEQKAEAKKRLEEQKAEALEKKKRLEEQKAEALEKKKHLDEQKTKSEAKKKEAAQEKARRAQEKADKAKADLEKKRQMSEELARMREREELAKAKEKETQSQGSLGESESALPSSSQGMKSNLKGSVVKKHSTRVSFAEIADTSAPPAIQKPTKQTPILPPGFERNNQEAPDWVNTRKTPSSGVKASQPTNDATNEASEPVTNETTAKPKSNSQATEGTKAKKIAAGKATPPKPNGKAPASTTKQPAKKPVEPESESESGSETGSETSSETGPEPNNLEAQATKGTPITVLKSPKATISLEDLEMPDAPSSPTPKQPFEVTVYKKQKPSDKKVEETESDSERAPPSGQKAREETESESDSDSRASASGTDSGSDSESDSGAAGKKKPTLAKTLFKQPRTYGKRHSLSSSQSINGSQRYKSLTAMEMAPIPDVREVHQSSQSARTASTPKANGTTKSQKSKKPAVPDSEDSEDSGSSDDSSGSSDEEEAVKPKNNALNGRMASGCVKRKSGFGGFGFKV